MITMFGCSNQIKKHENSNNYLETKSDGFWINQYIPIDKKQIYTIENTENGLYRFCYYEDMQPVREKITEDTYEGIYYDIGRKVLYSYNREKKQLEVLNLKFEIIDVLVPNLQLFEIKNMIGIGTDIYALIVPENPFESEIIGSSTGEGGYLDFGEQLYVINSESGEMRRIEIDNPICITQDEEGLLIYCYQQGDYKLIRYIIKNGEIEVLQTMKNMGYLFAMVYKEHCLYYTGSLYSGLWKYDLLMKENVCLNEKAIILKDADFHVLNEKIYMLDHLGGKIYQY